MRLAQKKYYEKNKEMLKAKSKKYYYEHKERYKELKRKWREENRSAYNKYESAYQKMRREKARSLVIRKCKYCGISFTPKKSLHQIFCSASCRRKQSYKNLKELKIKTAMIGLSS